MKRNILTVILLAIVVDSYYFNFALRVLPSVNSKMVLAVVGAAAFVFQGIRDRTTHISRRIFVSAILAVIFSLWCYFAIVANGTNNKEFADYFVSFAVWVGGAYGVYVLLKGEYERVDLTTTTWYLALVCASQCVIALLIDNVSFIHDFVDRVFYQPTQFYEFNHRLYGIACALDPAGIRFSAAQVLIAHQLAVVNKVRKSARRSSFYIVCFLMITVVGSMISRTTIVGTVLGLAYILFGNLRMGRGGNVSKTQLNSILLLTFLIGGAVVISAILYNANPDFRADLRFGFEGFFNWVETGTFSTNSTNELQTRWVWPTTPRGWLIGEGRRGVFETGSDIGYCNYILYCGLIGMAIYSFYYIYNHLSLISKFRGFTIAAFMLVAVTFIVWAKVTTDIFLMDALLFCIDGDFDEVQRQE